MASPPVRRQVISIPFLFPTTTSRTTPQPAIPTTTSTSTGLGLPPSIVSSASNSIPSSPSSISQSTTSSGPTPGLPSSITPSLPTLLPTSTPNVQITTTGTTFTGAPLSTGTSESKGKSFLENKPLAGLIFGLAGLAVLVILIVAVTSYVRRRNKKRLLIDASDFFDPRVVEDETSTEKYSHSGLGGHHNSGHGHGDYTFDTGAASGFTRVDTGGVSRPALPSPPMATYNPHDYSGHDGGYPTRYHDPSNSAIGYNLAPNPYDMYGPRNGGGYSNGQDQYDLYDPFGSSGDHPSMSDPGPPVPRQLQPGLHPAQGRTFAPFLSSGPPPSNRSPPIPSTTSPPPVSLRPSASEQHDIPRLPIPGRGTLSDPFGRRRSGDDDAYSGAFLGDSPSPESRRLQVANM